MYFIVKTIYQYNSISFLEFRLLASCVLSINC